MPELYLFGAIILTFFFIVFWLVIAIKALADKMNGPQPEVSLTQGRSRKGGEEWSWTREDDAYGILRVDGKEYHLFNSCHMTFPNSPLVIDIQQREEVSCKIVDVLINGHSIGATSPHNPFSHNEAFMAHVQHYALSLRNQGILTNEDLETLEEVYGYVQVNDRLLREGKVKQPMDAELADYIWVG